MHKFGHIVLSRACLCLCQFVPHVFEFREYIKKNNFRMVDGKMLNF